MVRSAAKRSVSNHALAIGLLLLATPAHAQSDRHHAVVQLSRVLGESHALRQACQGEDDQYWRARMERLLDTEKDPAAAELKLAFNAGYAARHGAGCTPQTRAVTARVAARGRELASELASEPSPPVPMAQDAPPR